jgi:formylglycine-generating enzyme required for sulfatase activity
MLAAALIALLAATPPDGMVKIPAGAYAPIYGERVEVAAFALDRLPVTRGEFTSVIGEDARRPAVGITWFEAKQYCEARGKRLPTTAEWERAASATPIAEQMSLYATRRFGANAGMVGRGERNRFGVADLHGLVWEWTLDFDAPAHGASHHHAHAEHNGVSCASAAIGATNVNDYPAFLRNAVRAGLERTSATASLGFRCAANL